VQWGASPSSIGGGFAAWDGDYTVKLNNSTSLINWGSLYFVPSWKSLKFGHYTASGTVIWDKQLGLGATQNHFIRVERGRDLSRADVVFNQGITGGVSSITNQLLLQIEGDGRMDIRVNNPNLQSTLNIYGAELRLHSAGRLPFVLQIDIVGGTLTLDNRGKHDSESGGYYTANRLNSSAFITMRGGSLRLWGQATNNNSIQQIKAIEGGGTIDIRNNNSGRYTQLRMEHFEHPSIDNYVKEIGVISFGTLNLTSNVDYVAETGTANSVSIRFSEWGGRY